MHNRIFSNNNIKTVSETICEKINYASIQHQEGDQLPQMLQLRRPSNEQVSAQAVDLFWFKIQNDSRSLLV